MLAEYYKIKFKKPFTRYVQSHMIDEIEMAKIRT